MAFFAPNFFLKRFFQKIGKRSVLACVDRENTSFWKHLLYNHWKTSFEKNCFLLIKPVVAYKVVFVCRHAWYLFTRTFLKSFVFNKNASECGQVSQCLRYSKSDSFKILPFYLVEVHKQILKTEIWNQLYIPRKKTEGVKRQKMYFASQW